VNSTLQLTGIGLRTAHYTEFLQKRPRVAWLEVHSENYFAEGGRPTHVLESLRQDYPISLHGVSLSLGSTDELNWPHLKKLRDLMARVKPCLVSDHLAWSSIDGHYFHDLLPLPYTEEALDHLVTRIKQVQEYLGQQILLENISSYLRYSHSTIAENVFLVEVAKQAACGILLDINNIYVNATNFDQDPQAYLAAIPGELVQEIHLAGFSSRMINDKEVLIDSHNKPVVPAVWDLYRAAIHQFGCKPTIIEWDSDLPSLDTLCLQAYRAEQIMREAYAITKSAS